MKFSFNNWRALLLGIAACCCAAEMQADVRVDNAWIKLAPPGAAVNAAYMQLSNQQLYAQTIVGVNADCCAMAMLHQMQIEGDKASMVHLDELVIPPQSSVQLAPGGLHIMLMQPREKLALDRKVRLSLKYSDGHSQTIEFVVKKDEQ